MQPFLGINIISTITPPYKMVVGCMKWNYLVCYKRGELIEYIPPITMGTTTTKKRCKATEANVLCMQSICDKY